MGHSTHEALANQRAGILLSLFAILCGFSLGGIFGGFEDDLKAGLRAKADAVLQEHYGGSQDESQKVVDKAWTYHKRAHMHWGGIGAATLAISMLLALTNGSRRPRKLVSLAIGLGAISYPIAWLLAGRSAPGLGSTGAAKDRWELLFQVPATLLVLGTLAALVLVFGSFRSRSDGA